MEILKDLDLDESRILPFALPMSKQRSEALQVYDKLFNDAIQAYQAGLQVAIVAEGDAGFYSSIQYIYDRLTEAKIPVRRIAGVPAFIAAGALASVPPSPEVMKRKPRDAKAFIVVPAMRRLIVGTAVAFVVILLGLLYVLDHYAGGTDASTEVGLRNLTVFFTTFVMLQFWNMFNAKTFGSNDSAFRHLSKSQGFLVVGLAIVVGQVLVVEFGGSVFRTVPLSIGEWAWIVAGTSLVLWVGEIFRAIRRLKDNRKEK